MKVQEIRQYVNVQAYVSNIGKMMARDFLAHAVVIHGDEEGVV